MHYIYEVEDNIISGRFIGDGDFHSILSTYLQTISSMELEIKKLKEDYLLVKRQYSALRQEGDNEAIATIELQSQLQVRN